ncbi:MAG: ISL3 family transposase, partial [Burkholderia sp.]
MHSKLFETALGISDPWFVNSMDFDAAAKRLTGHIDFVAGSRFPHPEIAGGYPVHATVVKRCRHLNFFQHDCFLEVRTPRIK